MHMENCIFCKIVRKEIPCHQVYEDDDFLAFLDIEPKAPGHVQIIPKNHYRWVWDVPNAGAYFEVARKVAQAQKKAFNADMVRSQIYGEQVPHAHIWVWPEAEGDTTDFKGNAEKIIRALSMVKTAQVEE